MCLSLFLCKMGVEIFATLILKMAVGCSHRHMDSYVPLRKNHESASGIVGLILSILDKDIVVINKLWLTGE